MSNAPSVTERRSKLPDTKVTLGAAACAVLAPLIAKFIEAQYGVTLTETEAIQIAALVYALVAYVVPPKAGDLIGQ